LELSKPLVRASISLVNVSEDLPRGLCPTSSPVLVEAQFAPEQTAHNANPNVANRIGSRPPKASRNEESLHQEPKRRALPGFEPGTSHISVT
jgi:hypothetical protein